MNKLVSRSPDQHRRNGIDLRTRTEVVGIDLAARTVQACDNDAGREYDEPYDDLVYATGSVPARPPVPGIDAAGVYGVQTLDDGAALRAELDAGHVQHVVIIGGGYIGLEVAEACQVRGLDVTVVDRSATPVGTFDPDVGRFIADAVRKMGVKLVLSDGVAEIETGDGGRAAAVHTASGLRLPADLVVLGLGVRPNVALARDAGSRSAPRAASRWTTGCAPGPRGCGRRVTASSRSTGCRASAPSWRWAPTRTSRAGSRASTSAAATPRSPA